MGPTHLITACRVLYELQMAMPGDCTYVVDTGNNLFYCTHYLKIESARNLVGSQTLASMGASLGLSIGLQRGRPRNRVVCVIGDGGLRMQEGDLSTLAREGLPVIVLVLDDRSMGMVDVGMKGIFGRCYTSAITRTDFSKLADAHGMDSFAVHKKDDLVRRSVELANRSSPILIHARIDALSGLPANSRFASVADQGT